MKAFVSFDPYFTETHTAIYEGKTEVNILEQVLKNHGYGLRNDNDEPVAIGNDKYALLEYLEDNNGDGCDFVISIINLDNGEIIFNVDKEEY